ncbi:MULTISPECIES: hypothetical protein [unclassified Novosphingobium]|uniref:hypothetical protein n=1 Tax=unclassified Novosphingobium TaxID=2644732 RepID=UPI0013568D24|nr:MULTISPECIES: hypothetical protein [unclassified Novosphingobium]
MELATEHASRKAPPSNQAFHFGLTASATDGGQHDRHSIADRCKSLLEADASLRSITSNGLLSHEARLILQLAVKDGTIVKEAALSSHLSDRAFYQLSKRLECHGVIRQKAAPGDLRTKQMHLSDALWHGLARIMRPSGDTLPANVDDVTTGRIVGG